jgi:hypothetical protein
MADSPDDFFYDTTIDTSPDEFDNDTEILTVVALLVQDMGNHVEQCREGCIAASPHDPEAGYEQLWRDYFHQTVPLFKALYFCGVFGCQGSSPRRLCTE